MERGGARRARRSAVLPWPRLLLALLLAACASGDAHRPASTSAALDGRDTRLGRRVAEFGAAHPGASGFYLLGDGVEALGARIAMAERAERSIDAQYYFILDDPTGHAFVAKLLEAADRGVRVRLLIDDIATGGYESGMAALHSHPNFEIRVFNPFSRRTGRVLDFVTDFGRVNRRMHNKSFTVDGSVTVVGGRNIGAEYFAARDDLHFGDLDVLGIGAVARDVSEAFDAYWNSSLAVPADALVGAPADPDAAIAERRERARRIDAELAGTRYMQALRASILTRLTDRPDLLTWAGFRVVWDPPEKALAEVTRTEILGHALGGVIDEAEADLLVISPYFVPQQRGVEFFRRLRDRQVEVTILTNSLAATDVAAVHAGYAPYRKNLLELGVRLFEMRPDVGLERAKQRTGMAFSRSSLHGKGFTVDDAVLFVGSFNWDPRSLDINTEMGILIRSPELAASVSDLVRSEVSTAAYEVVLDERGRLRWQTVQDGRRVVFSREPEAGVWRRLGASLLRLLPIRGQL